MRNQRQYEKEFGINAIKHCESRDKSLVQVAKDLGVPPSTLSGRMALFISTTGTSVLLSGPSK